MTGVQTCALPIYEAKWCPAVKFAKYEGIVKAFTPDLEGNMRIKRKLLIGSRQTDTGRNVNQYLEKLITENAKNAAELFIDRKSVV